MAIAAILFIIVILAVMIYGMFVFPVWMIVNCANSSRPSNIKRNWIIFLVLVWPIASFIYALVSFKKRSFQWISSLTMMVIAICVIVFAFFAFNIIKKEEIGSIDKAAAKIDSLDIAELSLDEITLIRDDFSVLSKEAKNAGILTNEKIGKAALLARLFDIITEDNKLSRAEYGDWINKFESRNMIDDEKLEDYVSSLKERPIKK